MTTLDRWLLAALLGSSVAVAQKPAVVTNSTGSVVRYLGDTIWFERDTTMRRSVFHGDTVISQTLVNGRPALAVTYVAIGDSARVVSATDPTGQIRVGMSYPVRVASADREALIGHLISADMETQSAALRARMPSSVAARVNGPASVPLSPPTPVSYCLDAFTTITQHLDTARYVRAVPGRRSDTTTYVFTGDTTVRRVSPSLRDFGMVMNVTIVGDMYLALIRKSNDQRNAALVASVPGRSFGMCR